MVADEVYRVMNLDKPKVVEPKRTAGEIEKEQAEENKCNAKLVKDWQRWLENIKVYALDGSEGGRA